jgi:hypothetical protein
VCSRLTFQPDGLRPAVSLEKVGEAHGQLLEGDGDEEPEAHWVTAISIVDAVGKDPIQHKVGEEGCWIRLRSYWQAMER